MKHRRTVSSGKRETPSLSDHLSVQKLSAHSQLQQVSDAQSRMMRDMDKYLRDQDSDTGKIQAEKDRLVTENNELRNRVKSLTADLDRISHDLRSKDRENSTLQQRITEYATYYKGLSLKT